MTLESDASALRKIPLFRGVDDQKLRLLAFLSERIEFDEGENLMEEGDFGDTAYIIIDGTADVVIQSPAGEQKVASVAQNDFVGEIAILIDVPRTATVRATSTVVALSISKEHFFKMLSNFPDMALEVMRALAHRLERTTRDLGKMRAKVADS